ncbi:MAG: chromosome segregation protein ScpA, partial [Bacteroidetes bacterium]
IDADLKEVAKKYALELDLNRVDLYQLLKVYEKALDRYVEKNTKVVHTIIPYPYSVAGQKVYLRQRLAGSPPISFAALILENPHKISVIFNFLAILELLQLAEIEIQLEAGFNNFYIQAKKVAIQEEG